MTTTAITTVELPDGSVATVEPRSYRLSIISRYVDGHCVWGQAFSSDEHEAQVAAVLDQMSADPAAFHRWWLA